ncbi:MAG TPA: HlyD family efflux transporter periplasmic adaptor subunit, partial [Anaerolineae bacterium]|nr:HlyD family efflux transporter periplasmic adaptor subunit [Anaerolineae bacterium]
SNIVQSTGSLIPASKVQLAFGSSGTVAQVNVALGDHVKKGDVLASVDATDLQLKVTQAQQSYLIQQLTYSSTVQPDATSIAQAQASYASALASYNAARVSYNTSNASLASQCPGLVTAQTSLDQAQAAYDRLANDHQAKNYLSGDWGPFQSVVNQLTNAQSAYQLAVANCNIAKTGLTDSSVRSAQAQLQNAKSNLDSLLSPRVETQIQAAAQLEQSRLSYELAKLNLAGATIVAPFDGVVTAVNTQVGLAGSSDAIELADVSQLHVDVLVDETEIALVQAKQKVELSLDAMAGITLTGQVAWIDPAGTISQGVVNYKVRVNLDATTAPVLLDMTANASIIGETHANVLAVPTTAIQSARGGGNFGGTQGGGNFGGGGNFSGGGNFGGNATGQNGTPAAPGGQTPQRIQGSFVLVVSNGQTQPVQVTVGMTSGDLTEISGNIQEGDEVIVGTVARTPATNNGGGFPGGGFPRGGDNVFVQPPGN